MAELEHWIAATAGEDERPADGFLWLDPRHTGGQGHLWLLVDGVGGRGVGDAVAALVTITVTELYPEALDMFRDPLKAIEVAIQDADRRLAAIKGVYSNLSATRASYVAVALFNGAYHVAWAGSARAYRVVAGEATRLTEDRVESVKDGLVQPATGVGSGASILHFAGSFEPENAAIVLATDGVSRSLRDAVVGQGVERLRAWDAVTSLLELAETAGSRDSKALAVVRAIPLEVRAETTVDAFKDWAESGESDWLSKTLVLQTGSGDPPPKVPITNYPHLPPISGAIDPAEAEAVRESTMSFSPEDVRAIVEGASREPSGEYADLALARTKTMRSAVVETALEAHRAVSAEKTAEERSSPTPAGTMMFSPQELAQVRADAERGPMGAPADTADLELFEEASAFSPELEGTQLFSPQSHGSDEPTPFREDPQSADDTETWRGDSLGVELAKGPRSRVVALLIACALLVGACAAYFAFFRV